MDYITIASTGNATDFGDLNVGSLLGSGLSSPTRGVIGTGQNASGDRVDSIEYITIGTTGTELILVI